MQYGPAQFRDAFRIPTEVFNLLVTEATGAEEFAVSGGNAERAIPVHKQIAITVYRLGRTVSVGDVARIFGVSEGTVINSSDRAFSYMERHWSFMVNRLPQTDAECANNAAHWLWNGIFGLGPVRNVVAAIDGTLIPIWRPIGEPVLYYCRKGFHALNFQVVVDAQYRILRVWGGRPGSCWDGNCIKGSLFENWMRGLGSKFVVLADSGYVATANLLTPFKKVKGFLPPALLRFNYFHALSRNIAEKTIGVLKGRFRWMLKGTQFGSVKTYCQAFLMCCILHNLCIDFKDDLLMDALEHEAHKNLPKGFTELPPKQQRKIMKYVKKQIARGKRSVKVVADDKDEDDDDEIMKETVDATKPDFTMTASAMATRERVLAEMMADGHIYTDEEKNAKAEEKRLKEKEAALNKKKKKKA